MDGVFMLKGIKCCLLCLLFAVTVWSIMLFQDKNQLQDELIRLHVVGASNSSEDQAIKLQVKDAVVKSLENELRNLADMNQAKAYLQENLPKIEQLANSVLAELGCGETVTISLGKEVFDTRYYDTFILPAGVYEALRINIGEAEGKNWWCVIFPSLCLPATAAEFENVAAGAGFSEELIQTLESNGEYEIRFFLLDFLGRVENIFFEG